MEVWAASPSLSVGTRDFFLRGRSSPPASNPQLSEELAVSCPWGFLGLIFFPCLSRGSYQGPFRPRRGGRGPGGPFGFFSSADLFLVAPPLSAEPPRGAGKRGLGWWEGEGRGQIFEVCPRPPPTRPGLLASPVQAEREHREGKEPRKWQGVGIQLRAF